MNFRQIKAAIYGLYLTNIFGFKLKKENDYEEKKNLRINYAHKMLGFLNIEVKVENPELIPEDGQYLVLINHRSIIDPLVTEIALEKSKIFGDWVAKKELYDSIFFGSFVRNGGTILVDRDKSQMGEFFKETKERVENGISILMFPEGTRNKTDDFLIEFKRGANLIALKNKLPILPILIEDKTNEVVIKSFNDSSKQVINVRIGNVIPYKEKDLEGVYKREFNIE
jgi:1-acyl-sn-glycerol-3-phosphate acyltransferase